MTETIELCHWINGEKVSAERPGESLNPSDTREVVARTPDAGEAEVNAAVAAAKAAKPEVIVLCHGGPIAMPEDAKFVLDRVPGCHGFYGASSMERLPVELAIKAQVESFKGLRLG